MRKTPLVFATYCLAGAVCYALAYWTCLSFMKSETEQASVQLLIPIGLCIIGSSLFVEAYRKPNKVHGFKLIIKQAAKTMILTLPVGYILFAIAFSNSWY